MSERRERRAGGGRGQTGRGEQGGAEGRLSGMEELLLPTSEQLGWTRPPTTTTRSHELKYAKFILRREVTNAAHTCTNLIEELINCLFFQSRGERAAGNFTVNK